MEVSTFNGSAIQKNHLFLEMKRNLRECSIPSLAPTSRFKKKRLKFKATTSGKLNSKQNISKGKNSFNNQIEEIKKLYSRLPDDFKFYMKFELKRVEFKNYKRKIRELKNSKIRSTFGGSKEVDSQLEDLMEKLYSIIRELNIIGKKIIFHNLFK